MKNLNPAIINKTAKSLWDRTKPAFQKYGDKLLFALALAVLAAGLFNQDEKKAIIQAEAPSIVFTQWWQDYLEKDTLQSLIGEYENLHGEIKIVLNDINQEDLRRALFNPSEISRGDVLALDALWVPELLERGVIKNTEAPLLSFVNVLCYNIDLLKKAGLTRPPKNFSEFIAGAKAVTSKEENRWGLVMDRNSPRFIYDDVYPWIWAAGVRLTDNGKPAVNGKTVSDVLSFISSLESEGLIAPEPSPADSTDTENIEKKVRDFILGRAAFMITSVKNIAFIRESMGDETLGVTSIPVPLNYAGKTFHGSTEWTLGVNTASAHMEEAEKFAAFLAEKAPYLAEEALVPAGNLAGSSAADPFITKIWDIIISSENAQDFSGLPREHELEEIFKEELLNLFAEKLTAREAAAVIQKRWEETLGN